MHTGIAGTRLIYIIVTIMGTRVNKDVSYHPN